MSTLSLLKCHKNNREEIFGVQVSDKNSVQYRDNEASKTGTCRP